MKVAGPGGKRDERAERAILLAAENNTKITAQHPTKGRAGINGNVERASGRVPSRATCVKGRKKRDIDAAKESGVWSFAEIKRKGKQGRDGDPLHLWWCVSP